MNRIRMVVIGSWLMLALGSLVLTGCHTVHGAGEDIQGAGRAIEHATE